MKKLHNLAIILTSLLLVSACSTAYIGDDGDMGDGSLYGGYDFPNYGFGYGDDDYDNGYDGDDGFEGDFVSDYRHRYGRESNLGTDSVIPAERLEGRAIDRERMGTAISRPSFAGRGFGGGRHFTGGGFRGGHMSRSVHRR
jgi:hypothetical protein